MGLSDGKSTYWSTVYTCVRLLLSSRRSKVEMGLVTGRSMVTRRTMMV